MNETQLKDLARKTANEIVDKHKGAWGGLLLQVDSLLIPVILKALETREINLLVPENRELRDRVLALEDRLQVAEKERDEALALLSQTKMVANIAILKAEKERDEAEIAFRAAHAEMDGAEVRLGISDAWGATLKAQKERLEARLQAAAQVIESLTDRIRRAKDASEAIMAGHTVIPKIALSGAIDDLEAALLAAKAWLDGQEQTLATPEPKRDDTP